MISTLLLLSSLIDFRIAYVRIAGERAELVIRESNGRSKVINSRTLNFESGDISGDWRWVHNNKLRRSFAFSTDLAGRKFFLLNVGRSWQEKNVTDWRFHSNAQLITIDSQRKKLATEDVVLDSDKLYFLGETEPGKAGLIRKNDRQYAINRKGSWFPADFKLLPSSFRSVVETHQVPSSLKKQFESIDMHDEISLNRHWVNIDLPTPSSTFFTYLSDTVGSKNQHLFYDGVSIWRNEKGKATCCTNENTKTLYFVHWGSSSQCIASRAMPSKSVGSDGGMSPSTEYQKYYVSGQPPFIPSTLEVINFKTGQTTEIGSGLYGISLP